ncbi:MAG: leucine-rich repeat domain-containing protein [Treponemataceae bacterium]|nr:leucine-rich repeat domain-containing protein [Treponemataceae bacterium]
MNKKWVAVLAAMAVTAAAFAAKAKFPSYLNIQKITGRNGELVVLQGVKNQNSLPAELVIPDGVTAIGSEAFRGCSSLASVTIPDGVMEIGVGAFIGCGGLKSVTIPDSVTAIGAGAFTGCGSLKSMTIPGSVKAIGNFAFKGCTSLTSVMLANGLEDISSNTFEGCTSLNEVQFDGTMMQLLAIRCHGEEFLNPWPVSVRCTDGVVPKYIGMVGTVVKGPGYSKDLPSDLVIIDVATKIGGYAFRDCTSLVSVAIPDSVTKIEGYAFEGCTSLAIVTIPNSVTEIGERPFYGCNSFKKIQFNGTKAQWDAIQGSNWVKVQLICCTDGIIGVESVPDYLVMDVTEVAGYTGKLPANLVIPDGVTKIRKETFKNCLDIESVSVPASMTDALLAFSGCTYLEHATIGSGATKIPNSVFSGCTALKTVTVPDTVTEIGGSAFSNCASLAGITIPGNVTKIGGYAFNGCASLKNVTIPDGVTQIEQNTFSDCTSLTSITIPRNVSQIGNYAFKGCASIKSVAIPRGVTKIGQNAFQLCTSLASVSIPRSVTEIGSSAFARCSPNLKVQYDGTKAQWGAIKGGGKPNTNIQCTDGTL